MDPQTLARALKDAVSGDPAELVRLAHLDPAGLAVALRRHQVAGYACTLLRSAGCLERVPAELARPLQHAHASQIDRNPMVLARTREVLSLLEAAQIPSIVLKGVYYAQRLQGGLDRRFMWDCDVLVPPNRFPDSIERLLAEGFTVSSGILLSRRMTWRHVHSVDLERDGLGLDLHCRFRRRPGYAIDYDDVWRRRGSFAVADGELPVLSDHYELTFLALSLMHDIEAGRGKLKHFLDLYLLLRGVAGNLSWRQFIEERRRERIDRLVLTALALTLRLFDAAHELPALTDALPREVDVRDDLAADLLSRRRQDPRSRFWLAGLSPAGRLGYLAWWAATVPFRYAAGRRI